MSLPSENSLLWPSFPIAKYLNSHLSFTPTLAINDLVFVRGKPLHHPPADFAAQYVRGCG